MNINAVKQAFEHYREGADEHELHRLSFFEGLYEHIQSRADELAKTRSYEVPTSEEVNEKFWAYTAVLLDHPVKIDAEEFAVSCKDIANYLADAAGFEDAVSDALRAYDWSSFVEVADLELAGKNPSQFIEESFRNIDAFKIDPSCPSNIIMMVASYALRAHLQQAAEAIMAENNLSQTELNKHDKPLRCPVCGSFASAAMVGESIASDSKGHELYCTICGAQWPFERIRCASCGTTNQGHIHWFHIEGDDAHRLQNCDECGDYMRTVFQDESEAKPVMEVEDVVMARLDAIALDPKFSSEVKE